MKRIQCMSMLMHAIVFFAVLGVTTHVAASQREHVHVHGLARLDIVIDAQKLVVQLHAPLDTLLGFEHHPRNAAQRQVADTVLAQLRRGAELLQPPRQASCTLGNVSVDAQVLQPRKSLDTQEKDHADLEAGFEFICEKPEKLTFMEIGFFEAFQRIQKIEIQAVTPQGQSKHTLKRPARVLRLSR